MISSEEAGGGGGSGRANCQIYPCSKAVLSRDYVQSSRQGKAAEGGGANAPREEGEKEGKED
eukprot:92197-Rhodomonas_salina.1